MCSHSRVLTSNLASYEVASAEVTGDISTHIHCPSTTPHHAQRYVHEATHASLYRGSQGRLASQGPPSSPETHRDINNVLPTAPLPSFQHPGPPDLSKQLQPVCRAIK